MLMEQLAADGIEFDLPAACRNAPLVEATPEEMAAFEVGMADIRAGRTVSSEQIRASIEARSKHES